MRLIDSIQNSSHRLVAPLMGYPGAKLTRSSLRQNGFNAELHYRSIHKLVEVISARPDILHDGSLPGSRRIGPSNPLPAR